MTSDERSPSPSRSSRRRRTGTSGRPGSGPDAGRTRAAQGADGNETVLEVLDRLPVWAAPVLYLVLTAWLFRGFIFSGDMLFGMDTMTLGYQARVFFAEALRTTGFPLWNPHILGGTPFLESLAGGDSLHPLSVLLFFLVEPYRALGWKLVLHVFLAGLFMTGWLRTLGCTRGAALLGGTGAVLAPSFVTLVYPGHDGKMFVVAMTPLLFWLGERMWRRDDLVPAALLAVAIALVLFSTHFQMAYFLFGALGAWMTLRAVQVGRRQGWAPAARRYATFLLFSLLGAGTAAIQLLPAVGYVTEFSRRAATTVAAESPEAARAYSSSWSLHPEEAVSLVVPEFIGNNAGGGVAWTTDTYWGRNAFKLNHEYLGAVLLLLALVALLPIPGGGRRPSDPDDPAPPAGALGADPVLRWALAGGGAMAALFALGAHTPVWRIAFEVLPGISLFRAPSMAIFLTAFAVTTLAALGLDRGAVLLQTAEGRRRLLRWSGGFTGLLALGALLAGSGVLLNAWEAVVRPDLSPAQARALDLLHPYLVQGFAIVTLLTAAGVGLFWATGSGKLPPLVLLPGLLLLVTVDLTRVNTPFIQTTDPTLVALPDANHRFLLERMREQPPFRVLSMVQGGQDVGPSAFGIDLAAGHHPNDLLRYRELIGMEGSGLPEHLVSFHPVIMGILNIRYILWPDGRFGPLEGLEPLSRITLADGSPWTSVYPYPGLPRARLVTSYRLATGPGETLDILLNDNSFDPVTEVVLEVSPPLEPQVRPQGGPHPFEAVRWLEQEPDRLVLEVDTEVPALLVVSQNWFPSWVARVGGETTPVLRADHALQAIAIPAGQHRVELVVSSPELRRALVLSLLSLLVVTGAGIGSGLRLRRRGTAVAGGAPGDPGPPQPDAGGKGS